MTVMIAAGAGYDEALEEVGKGYRTGHVTKDITKIS